MTSTPDGLGRRLGHWWKGLSTRRKSWTVVGAGILILAVIGSLDDVGGNNSPPRITTTDALAGMCAQDGASMLVDATCFNEDWPLTVTSGVLKCEDSAVIFTSGGRTYAVNGMATTWDLGVDIDPIWADNPELEGLKINIGPLIAKGLTLCE